MYVRLHALASVVGALRPALRRCALGGVVAQSALMSIVPRHFMGRTQSAMAIVTTAVQLAMCVALGWIAERAGIIAGYTLLALLYAGATLTAFHARQLLRVAAES